MQRLALSLLSVLVLGLALGCAGEPELQTVEFKKFAYFQAPTDWLPKGNTSDGLLFEHAEYPGVRLWVDGRVDQVGGNITATVIRGMIGKEINLEYGGAISRVSLTGNAVIRWKTEGVEEDDSDMVNWIVAKPHAGSNVLRMEVSLEYDPDVVDSSEMEALVEQMDPYLSDAGFPSTEA